MPLGPRIDSLRWRPVDSLQMDSPLVPVFVAVIAIAAIMQAVFVAALAIALRVANARMAVLQDALDREIAKPVADMARMAEIAVRASEQTLFHAQRLEGLVEEAAVKIRTQLRSEIMEAYIEELKAQHPIERP